jgi:DNA excision repair protein ERCC-3
MIAYTGKRSAQSEKIMEDLSRREWGLMILDEVHVVPADVFKTVFQKIAAHCKLGMTKSLPPSFSSLTFSLFTHTFFSSTISRSC